MPKKNKIFSGRPYNPRGSVKRFNKRVLPKIMNHASLEDLTLEERRDLKAYVRSQQKEIAKELNTVKAQQTITGKQAIMERLADRKLTDDPIQLFSEWHRQKEFRQSIQVDYSALKEAEKDKNFKAVVEDDDKWTILRRLAIYDPRLNIDRSYASDVLREIEDIIEQAKVVNNQYSGMSYQDIADMLLNEYNHNGQYNFMKEWDEDMFDMSYDEDDFLFGGRNFHGRDRAEADREREKRKVSRQLSSYDPSYQNPFDFLTNLDMYD